MRRTFLTYVLALFSVLLFAQNENPYSQFGYEAPIMKNQDSNKDLITRLVIINADTTTEVGWIEVDVASHTIFSFSRDGEKYFQDSLPITILTRWLTTDPANQYHSPYIGMGNDPINGVDPDGARKVYYNADGTYSHTDNHIFFNNRRHDIFIANANGYGYTNVSYAAFDNWQSDMFPQGWGARAIDWQFTPKGNEINPVDGSILGGGALINCYPEEFILTLGMTALARKGATKVGQEVVENYVLKAADDGLYPVMKRGFSGPVDEVLLKRGDVWKYGTTKNPTTRYTQKFLDNTGEGLYYKTYKRGSGKAALQTEKSSIIKYENVHGTLPPGNKIRR